MPVMTIRDDVRFPPSFTPPPSPPACASPYITKSGLGSKFRVAWIRRRVVFMQFNAKWSICELRIGTKAWFCRFEIPSRHKRGAKGNRYNLHLEARHLFGTQTRLLDPAQQCRKFNR